MTMLEVRNFKKSYGKKEAVKGIDLYVEAGEIVGFIGHNGAGKTTTLKAIAGILSFEEGRIIIGGRDITEEAVSAKQMSFFVPDEPILYEYLTGFAFLDFIADMYEISKEKRSENISRFATALGIYDDLSDVIGSYSHGMKQKLSVVSALMCEPAFIILDEPFVGLDPIATKRMVGYLRDVCDMGGAVLFSTHVLDQAQKICDKIYIIKDGLMVAGGKTDDVIGSTSLEDVFIHLAESAHE